MAFVPIKSLEEGLAALEAGLLWRDGDMTEDRTQPNWRPGSLTFSAATFQYYWNANSTLGCDYQRRDFAVFLED